MGNFGEIFILLLFFLIKKMFQKFNKSELCVSQNNRFYVKSGLPNNNYLGCNN